MVSTYTNATTLACESARELLNPGMIAVMITIATLDASSLILYYFYGRYYFISKSVHPNFKVLITGLTLTLVFRNFFTMLRAFRILFSMIATIWRPCAMLTIYTICAVEATIGSIPISIAIYMFSLVTIERVMATILQKYENIRFVKLCIFLTISGSIFNWVSSFKDFVAIFQQQTIMMPYCSSISAKTIDLSWLLWTRMPVDIGIIIVAIITYFINKRANPFSDMAKGSSYLTSRYQRSENIEVTKIMTFQLVLFCSVQLTSIYLTHQLSLRKLESIVELAILKETISFGLPIYGNVHVILALIISKRMRYNFFTHQWLYRFLPNFFKEPSSSVFKSDVNIGSNYFDQYQKHWGIGSN